MTKAFVEMFVEGIVLQGPSCGPLINDQLHRTAVSLMAKGGKADGFVGDVGGKRVTMIMVADSYASRIGGLQGKTLRTRVVVEGDFLGEVIHFHRLHSPHRTPGALHFARDLGEVTRLVGLTDGQN